MIFKISLNYFKIFFFYYYLSLINSALRRFIFDDDSYSGENILSVNPRDLEQVWLHSLVSSDDTDDSFSTLIRKFNGIQHQRLPLELRRLAIINGIRK